MSLILAVYVALVAYTIGLLIKNIWEDICR